MSNVDPDKPEFDEFDLPAEDMQVPDEAALGADTPEGLLEPDAAEAAPEPLMPAEGTPEPIEGGVGGLGAMAAGAAAEAEEEPEKESDKPKKPGLLQKLATTNPFVVLLGIAFVALLIGVLCLLLELGRYNYQTKPTQAGVAPAAQSSPLGTTWS